MAYGNNRAGEQPRSHFQQAGGSSILFKHPYLIGQLGDSITDTVDISSCVKLEGNYFNAMQNQDNAKQVVLIDGSVVTITNKLLNGTITMPVVKKTGFVTSGDFVAICHLIRSLGDNIGGLLIKTDYIDGKAITRVYYGVAVQSCPDDNSMGNDVGEYQTKLLYAGWAETQGSSLPGNLKNIWAVGNAKGLSAYFSPYAIQGGSTGDDPMTSPDAFTNASEFADSVTGNTGGSLGAVTGVSAVNGATGAGGTQQSGSPVVNAQALITPASAAGGTGNG